MTTALGKQVILVTGGNSGIGLSLAGLLAADSSKHVIITSRSVEKGEAALNHLRKAKADASIEMLQLEVTDPTSIETLAKKVDETHGRLDALVNNAAVAGIASTSLFENMQQCFAANVSGPAVMIESFLPLLQKSTTTPRIINVSSGGGSNGITLDPVLSKLGPLMIPYKTSKSALNMLSSVELAKFREAGIGIKVFTYCPGHCVSNLTDHNKAEFGAKPTEQGAAPMVAILNGEKDGEHGGYLNHSGGQHPW